MPIMRSAQFSRAKHDCVFSKRISCETLLCHVCKELEYKKNLPTPEKMISSKYSSSIILTKSSLWKVMVKHITYCLRIGSKRKTVWGIALGFESIHLEIETSRSYTLRELYIKDPLHTKVSTAQRLTRLHLI